MIKQERTQTSNTHARVKPTRTVTKGYLWNEQRGVTVTKEAEVVLQGVVVERSIRPITLGRKNWLFVDSDESARDTAIYLTLIGSCNMLGIEPYKYFETIVHPLYTLTPYKTGCQPQCLSAFVHPDTLKLKKFIYLLRA